jgi:hypothetical protein
VDPLEHLHWNDLIEGAQVLAVFAYTVAELPELLLRKQAKPEEKKQEKRGNGWSPRGGS